MMIGKDTLARFDIKQARKIGKQSQNPPRVPAYPYHSALDNMFVAYEHCFGEIPDNEQFLKTIVQEIVEEERWNLKNMILKHSKAYDEMQEKERELKNLKEKVEEMRPNLNNEGC